jgi:hypothetical protein
MTDMNTQKRLLIYVFCAVVMAGVSNATTILHVIVVRVETLSGKMKMSKPCKHCTEYLKMNREISYIFYSNENGMMVAEHVSTLTTEHVSIGNMAKA